MSDGPELVVARYGELWLKGRNRGLFAKILTRNARMALRPLADARVERLHGQLIVHAEVGLEDVARRLQDVFGFASISLAWRVPARLDDILERAPEVVAHALEDHPRSRPVTFRVTSKRADKSFPLGSTQLDREVADRVLPEHGERLKVKLKEPELNLEIYVRPEAAYLFAHRMEAAGGLPVGSLGRTVCLLSGGIDSPVAAWLSMKRGCHVSFVSFHSMPYLGESSREKIRRLARALARYQRASRLFSVPFARIQETIRDLCPEHYRTILYRRMMQRIADQIAQREHASALITGESVGQVASQTLENLRCIEEASRLPVLRPLISFDKQETIALAKRIGTFDISTLPEPDCCTVFQPQEPVIRGRPWLCADAETRFDVDGLVAEAVEGAELETFEFEG